MGKFPIDKRGAVAVEFAFVLPVFLTFVFFILNIGLALFTQVVLDNAVDAAARQIQIGTPNAATSAALKTFICSKTFSLIPSCTTNLQVYLGASTSFGGLTSPVLSASTITPATYTLGGTNSYQLLEVAYLRPFATPLLFNGDSSEMIVSASAIEVEPY